MEGRDLSLQFIDHKETKVQSPDREKIDLSKLATLRSDNQTQDQHVGNVSNETEVSGRSPGPDSTEGEIDRTEHFIQSDLNSNPSRNQGTIVSDAKTEAPYTDSFTYGYSLNDDDLALLNSQSSIDSENKVKVEKISDDSGFLEDKQTPDKEDEDKVAGGEEKRLSSEMKEIHSKAKKDWTYDFTSHTSNMLQYEKSRQTENTGRKRKEPSPLTIEELDTEGDEEEKVITTKTVPQQCSEDLQQSEMRRESQQPMSPTTFTKDPDHHLIFEEDEENVIIHLDTDFEQENAVPVQEGVKATTQNPVSAENSRASTDSKSVSMETKTSPIEVERKFSVTADTKIRLLELGAELRKEKRFEDLYYDNSDYNLTLSDCWLRQRNGTWEFKVAVSSFLQTSSSTQYSEITDDTEICRLLVRYLKQDESLCNLPLKELVEKLNLTVFARFTTTRQTYILPECTIDLDLADFGFQVGEIEVMVADESRIPDALKTIDAMAMKLGLPDKGPQGGKISAYLSTYNSKLYNLLLDARIKVPTDIAEAPT